MKKFLQDIYHFANGLYSNIPLCCVWFFVTKHRKYKNGWIAYELKKIRGEDLDDVEYVRCPKCFRCANIRKLREGVILTSLWWAL